MKTQDQLITPDVQEIIACHSQGLNTLTEAMIQLYNLDVGIQGIEVFANHEVWAVYSISDTYKVDFVLGVYAPIFHHRVSF